MFIDIHAHATRWPGPPSHRGTPLFSTPRQLLQRYDELEIDQAVLLPLVSPEVYLPQSVEEVLSIVQEHGGRFLAFCNIDPRAMTNSPAAPLGDLLRYYRDCGCKGIGEVMPNLPFLDPLVQNLMACAQEVGFPLTFDISTQIGGTYGLYDTPGLPQLETCLQRFPRLTILGHGPAFWSEIAELRTPAERGGYPRRPVEEEGVVPLLLRQHGNLWGDLSASSGYNALARDEAYAARFIEEFQDRLLFGTDICMHDQLVELPGLLKRLRDSGRISRGAFDKIARENAGRLLGL